MKTQTRTSWYYCTSNSLLKFDRATYFRDENSITARISLPKDCVAYPYCARLRRVLDWMVTSIVSTKRSLFFAVIVIAAVTSSLIFFAKVEARANNADWILSITAAVAASVAIAILYRQKHHNGFIEKADFALAMGLALSLCAAILWAVYEIILDVVPPVPSLADIFSE